jgi:acetylornithine deacetylase/succinyl-diaminopimelate desuccinylase-like protein
MSAEPRISAGGTYSRYLPNAIEVGMTLEHTNHNLPSGHGGCHQPDENISINGFLKALELVSHMVIRYDSDSI